MTLALNLGKTMAEMELMPASELELWAAYHRQSPIGERRADNRAASIVAAIYGCHGVKDADVASCRLRYGDDAMSDAVSDDDDGSYSPAEAWLLTEVAKHGST